MDRRTGRTFRTILEAAIKASEGYHVYYVCGNEATTRYTYHMARGIVGKHCYALTRRVYSVIVFESGGKIEFISKEKHKSLRYKSTDVTPPPLDIFDHFQG